MAVWDFDQPQGGLTKRRNPPRQKLSCGKGFLLGAPKCFRPETHPRLSGKNIPMVFVISHPECCEEVCALSDEVGSTEYIIKNHRPPPRLTLAGLSAPSSIWCNESPKNSSHRGKIIKFMSPTVLHVQHDGAH